MNSRFFGGNPDKCAFHGADRGRGDHHGLARSAYPRLGTQQGAGARARDRGRREPPLDLSCLQLHPKGIVVADEDSTMELKVGTVRYFKEIEAKNFDNGL